MKILYISPLSSQKVLSYLSENYNIVPYISVQKFGRLIANGFIRNDVDVETLTGLPLSYKNGKLIWWIKKETENGIVYNYIPFVNLPFIRHLCLLIYSFFFVLVWGLKNKENKCIICDVLNISMCIGSLLASKIINLKSIGIMTDMPGLMVNQTNNSKRKFLGELISTINKSYLSLFTNYVFLTEQMNNAINTKSRPYIIMEGLVDENMADYISKKNRNNKKILLYAGGLHEKYGLRTLVEAFSQIKDNKIQLDIYGNGPFVDELVNKYCKIDNRIIYHGIVANELIIEKEIEATLLVNPRPTNELFTQYSFPSKNMEYMVSGTPVLTTKLPGMPEEYYPYVYLFEDETVDGFAKTIINILNLSEEELNKKGSEAKKFVLEKKNNVYQAKKIIELINKL